MRRGPYAPRDLGKAGRRLWRDVVRCHDLTAGDLAVLIEVARGVDLCERLAESAQRPNCPRGVLVELRLQRAALAKLLAQLNV